MSSVQNSNGDIIRLIAVDVEALSVIPAAIAPETVTLILQ
jgi:hypothetical protein